MPVESAYTSRRIVPAFVAQWVPEHGSLILDVGGGKYEDTTIHLAEIGCQTMVLDPHNRSQAHNDTVKKIIQELGCNYIICMNVLNVIKDESERKALINEIISYYSESTKAIFFQIFEGNGSNAPSITTEQMNRKTDLYLPELIKWFGEGWEIKTVKRNCIKVTKII